MAIPITQRRGPDEVALWKQQALYHSRRADRWHARFVTAVLVICAMVAFIVWAEASK